jgi:hypothetical protein
VVLMGSEVARKEKTEVLILQIVIGEFYCKGLIGSLRPYKLELIYRKTSKQSSVTPRIGQLSSSPQDKTSPFRLRGRGFS